MLFADNVYEVSMHRYIHAQWWFSCHFLSTLPLLLSLLFPAPTACINPSFYSLGDPSSFARGANTHPLLSLVSYQLFSLAVSPTPRHLTLHIYIYNINNISRSCLIQILPVPMMLAMQREICGTGYFYLCLMGSMAIDKDYSLLFYRLLLKKAGWRCQN